VTALDSLSPERLVVHMSETSGQDKAGNEQVNDGKITVGWEAKPHPFGSVTAAPVRRPKSEAELAMANMLRLAAMASDFEDCKNKFEQAAETCRKYGLQLSPPEPPPPRGRGLFAHRARMDVWRLITTIILVLGVLAIVGWSLSLGDAAAAAQYVAPISGLAGICLGWLFTNQQSAPSPKEEDSEL
jgi:hypothetical protein